MTDATEKVSLAREGSLPETTTNDLNVMNITPEMVKAAVERGGNRVEGSLKGFSFPGDGHNGNLKITRLRNHLISDWREVQLSEEVQRKHETFDQLFENFDGAEPITINFSRSHSVTKGMNYSLSKDFNVTVNASIPLGQSGAMVGFTATQSKSEVEGKSWTETFDQSVNFPVTVPAGKGIEVKQTIIENGRDGVWEAIVGARGSAGIESETWLNGYEYIFPSFHDVFRPSTNRQITRTQIMTRIETKLLLISKPLSVAQDNDTSDDIMEFMIQDIGANDDKNDEESVFITAVPKELQPIDVQNSQMLTMKLLFNESPTKPVPEKERASKSLQLKGRITTNTRPLDALVSVGQYTFVPSANAPQTATLVMKFDDKKVTSANLKSQITGFIKQTTWGGDYPSQNLNLGLPSIQDYLITRNEDRIFQTSGSTIMQNIEWFDNLAPSAQTLCVNRIQDFDSLKQASRSTLVAVDFKGQLTIADTSSVTEVGLAVMPGLVTAYGMKPAAIDRNKTLRGFIEENEVQSYYMKVRQPGPIETSTDQNTLERRYLVNPEQVLTKLVDRLRRIWDSYTRPIILVGFNMAFEITMILSHYSEVTQYFSFWVDLQNIMAEFTTAQIPGLREILLAFEFLPNDLQRNSHSAEHDAVRKLAVLTNLLHLKNGSKLELSIQPKNDYQLRRYWSGFHPGPNEVHPFRAYLRVRGKPVSSIIPGLTELFDFFPSWKPTTVGWSRDRRYACICLSREEDLKRFIAEFHGREFKGETWEVFADHDPEISFLIPPHLQITNTRRRRRRIVNGEN
ncbi:hypothetical protein F4680DRAFT_445745 [Xylaria scruposa]|nr:hypothetical protein F4680DRAFT_445745 [Xylaria scruposa]